MKNTEAMSESNISKLFRVAIYVTEEKYELKVHELLVKETPKMFVVQEGKSFKTNIPKTILGEFSSSFINNRHNLFSAEIFCFEDGVEEAQNMLRGKCRDHFQKVFESVDKIKKHFYV